MSRIVDDVINRLDNVLEEYSRDEYIRIRYSESLSDVNNLPYWYPHIKQYFNTPNTFYAVIEYEWYKWLGSDNYTNYMIDKFSRYLIDMIPEYYQELPELFIKTGNFSNKFQFNKSCRLTELGQIGRQYLDMYYASMCVGCPNSPYLVVREFIHTKYDRGSIYDGMKLNTEYRVFYDFDNRSILGYHNYWDPEVMSMYLSDEDKEVYSNNSKELVNDYNNHKDELLEYVDKVLSNSPIGLTGKWSMDFMYDGDKFWLIDMAIAKNSYYFKDK